MAKAALILIGVIFAANLIGGIYNWYIKYPWFDIPMHILGGAWVALMFGYIFSKYWKLDKNIHSVFLYVLFITGCVALIGIFWEFFEFGRDYFVSSYNPSYVLSTLSDTLGDLLNDLIGGAISSSFVWMWLRKHAIKETCQA